MTPAVQTLWAELCVATLADAGVKTCVISPGSRSTPLVTALVADGRFDLPTIIDERSAAFFALGVARATGTTAAMLCTSGSAPAHYLPAIVEASESGVPLLAITADRPPELQHCGASQTVDQIKLYGGFVRESFDVGAPVGSVAALRALRRTTLQAVVRTRGPHPGPVHLEVPLRKPLEPHRPHTDEERDLAAVVAELRRSPVIAGTPRLVADPSAIAELASAIKAEPRGVIVAGAMPPTFAGDAVLALAVRAGYPVLAEAGSGLRRRPPRDVVFVDHFDLALASPQLGDAPPPALVLHIGAEPVAAGWATEPFARAARWMVCDYTWRDPASSARGVIVGEIAATCSALCDHIAGETPRTSDFSNQWKNVSSRAASAMSRALDAHPGAEPVTVRAALAALPDGAIVQVGNSLPIRYIDHVWTGGDHAVIAQRGAAGIDGMIASAAGATYRGSPVLLLVGDVSFAHDLGSLLATREAKAPLAIVVIDNGGGRIFDGMPIARATSRDALGCDRPPHSLGGSAVHPGAAGVCDRPPHSLGGSAAHPGAAGVCDRPPHSLGGSAAHPGAAGVCDRHFITPPRIDAAAVATALGLRASTVTTPAEVTAAVAVALAERGATIIHAPVTATGAHDVRRTALELFLGAAHA